MRRDRVPLTRVTLNQVHAVLRALHEDRRLVELVRKLAQEVERLDEDNAQLQAAIQVYREVARRRSLRSG